jgi:hypothetical protein
MKKILLVDVDNKLPNLALMQLSTYYKNKRYHVDFKKLNYSYYPSNKKTSIENKEYEKFWFKNFLTNPLK